MREINVQCRPVVAARDGARNKSLIDGRSQPFGQSRRFSGVGLVVVVMPHRRMARSAESRLDMREVWINLDRVPITDNGMAAAYLTATTEE